MRKKILNEYDMESILDQLRTFSYTTEVGGETVTVNVELFTHAQNKMATLMFLQRFGDRIADNVMYLYGKEELTATEIADIIKTMCIQKWKHWLECWKAEYNPIWNVDGTETRTIETKYGKVTTMAKNSKVTDEQKTDGKNNTTHGLVTTITEPTTTGSVATFDSANFVGASQTSATQHSNTDSGTTNVAISMGTVEHAASGSDTDTLSGKDTVTDTLVRGGNIGVTMTQQLLTAENNFWSNFSFFEQWFSDIADEISLPIWG